MPSRPSKRLQTFANPARGRDYRIHMEIPEFTCLCPLTGQPDFATLEVDYVPDRLCIELKALKLYVWSFRGEGASQYWRPGAIEDLLPSAGLTLETAFDLTWAYEYAHHHALAEAMLAAGGAAAIAGPENESALRSSLLTALAHCRQSDGRYLVSNEWHVVIARV